MEHHSEQGKIEGTETSPEVIMELPEIGWWQERKKGAGQTDTAGV